MAIKKRIKISDQASLLADEIADKAYGQHHEDKRVCEPDEYITTSISIPRSMLRQLEDMALANKRSGSDHKNVSALVRLAVKNLLSNN